MKYLQFLALLLVIPVASQAGGGHGSVCRDLPRHSELKAALTAANNSPITAFDLQNDMWATVVAADGTVCTVANSGTDNLQSQWLLSRVISGQKANTANGLSLAAGAGGLIPGLALSTANLMAAVQPGGSLYGLQFSNPVNTQVAYRGKSHKYGTKRDPMVGGKIGGVNIFGGGLALYDASGIRIGGIGVSGDSSCRDHFVAWETRALLELDYVPAGVNPDPNRPDNIILDTDGELTGFEHAADCVTTTPDPSTLSETR